MPLHVELITPERAICSTEADAVTFSGELGQIGVLPGHRPLVTTLRPGPLLIQKAQETHVYAVSSGLAEVAHDKIKILAEAAELKQDIDVERAERARLAAEKALKEQSEYDETFAEVQASYARALNRVDLSKL